MEQSATSSASLLIPLINNVNAPFIVAILGAFASFYWTRSNDIKKESERIKNERVAYIDLFILQINKIIKSLETLIGDLDEKKYFSYKNINNISGVIDLLSKKISDVIIFSNDKFRQQIITTIDNIITLNTDLRIIEDLQGNYNNEHKNNIEKFINSMYQLKIELLKIGYKLDANNLPAHIENPDANANSILVIRELTVELESRRTKSFSDLLDNNKFLQEKRTVLCTRILDSQSKLKELASELNHEKDILSKN